MSYQVITDSQSLPNVVNIMNKNIYELKNREVTEVYKDGSGKRRIILGKLPDGTYGLLISQEGYDVIDDIINA